MRENDDEVEQETQETPTKDSKADCDHDNRFSMLILLISNHFISVFIWIRRQGFVSPHISTTRAQHMSERVQGGLGKNQRKFKLIM